MSFRQRLGAVVFLMLLTGCPPAEMGNDGGASDAGTDARSVSNADSGAVDSGPLDASEERDAYVARDAAVDLPEGSVDAHPQGNCADASTELCNAFDDDCDGRVDESACTGCDARIGPSGHSYLFCRAALRGIEAWTRGCDRLGPGYRLVDLSEQSEVLFVEGNTTPPSWVGLHKLGVSDAFRDVTGATRDIASIEADPSDPSMIGEHCFALGRNGLRSEICSTSNGPRRGFVCEAPVLSMPPMGIAETCNGLDDNADGVVDDHGVCGGCEAVPFLGHEYYRCDSLVNWDAARGACQAIGADLIAVDSYDENEVLALSLRSLEIQTWIGGASDPARISGSSINDYLWVDGRRFASTYTNWLINQPLPEPMWRCVGLGISGSADHWENFSCGSDMYAFACERTPVVGP